MAIPASENCSESAEIYLTALGERVREIRARRGMTRKILSKDSGVSERYLAQEHGSIRTDPLALAFCWKSSLENCALKLPAA